MGVHARFSSMSEQYWVVARYQSSVTIAGRR
jgi:hypothetical protein